MVKNLLSEHIFETFDIRSNVIYLKHFWSIYG